MRTIARNVLITVALCLGACAATAYATQAPPVPAPSAPTLESRAKEVADLKRQVNDLLDQLAAVRAQRADCEATLGPIEADARQRDSAQRWAALKTALEAEHPGQDCNPRTLECAKRPEPPAAPPIKK